MRLIYLQYKQRCEETQRKMTQMAEQLSQLQRNAQQPVTQGAETEIIEALKQQIQICTEDFESERKDREKVQSKLHRALSDNEHLKKEVGSLCHINIIQVVLILGWFYSFDLHLVSA